MNLFLRLFSLVSSAKKVRSNVSHATNVVKDVNTKIHAYDTTYIHGTIEKAEEGNATAQFDLGDRFHDGLGVTQDYAKAAKWFRKAAKQGHVEAQANLGMMCALGRGLDRDYAEGFKWLSLATENGDMRAEQTRAKLAKRMTKEQITEGQRRASEFVASA